MNFVDAEKVNKCFKVAMPLACYVGNQAAIAKTLIAVNLHQLQLLYLYFSIDFSALRASRSSEAS